MGKVNFLGSIVMVRPINIKMYFSHLNKLVIEIIPKVTYHYLAPREDVNSMWSSLIAIGQFVLWYLAPPAKGS